ncbi:Transcription factor DUO1 [Vitis vinifera]|uniref:Transcription factor DUO1 n=1 Tax=Vitis vinifera TaxID=29760 RepID=A0A438FR07_VITVI|nr:Transcription factor DUO1 [Vitis vinifera]
MEGEREEIKKGPWKAEEDEVLINHVNKYGPRDWSSIRSKGLLQRTGKSCRLRWWVQVSSEEERLVIELQAQFGNKWARIATYLPGRTDNDVPNFSASMEEDLSSKSSYIDNSEMIKLVGLPDMVEPNLPALETNLFQLQFNHADQKTPCMESQSQFPFPHLPQPQPALTLSPESQELVARLDDPNFFDVFGDRDVLRNWGMELNFLLSQHFLNWKVAKAVGNERRTP